MQIKKTTKFLSLLCGFLFFVMILPAIAATANDPPPLATMRSAADKLIAELDRNQAHLKRNDQLVYNIVRRTIVPYFDLTGMSMAVVGRNYWQAGSSDLQKQFVNEFTLYVIRTYSSALESYSGEKVKFYPIRGYDATQKRVQVYSDILQNNGPAIPVSYRMAKGGSKWFIYDFSVEGVSIVQNYRSQFASTLQKGGLKQLVAEIHSHNKGVR
ncbi:MAG: hypothetical protein A2X78_04685 [Gammaproteobacteria bacterium GWE2_37_16]|nr:MAG: hypothetical protein A2X78_04685 [Gammaproteobacteria bacterium GWE2_37_16]